MHTTDFTHHPLVKEIIKDLKSKKIHEQTFSDVVDADGHQYVDLVQEGGGVLGIGLLGYTYVMEQMGIRFYSLAGTSAGAINTMMMAAVGEVEEAKSEKILHYLCNKDLFDFVDGSGYVRSFMNLMLKNSKLANMLGGVMGVAYMIYLAFRGKNYLNPGDDFHDWIKNVLRENKLIHSKQLDEKIAGFQKKVFQVDSDSRKRIGQTSKAKLIMIASDITTQTKVSFPAFKDMYWGELEINPADYVRASMSIPFFFKPLELKVPQDEAAKKEWYRKTKYKINDELWPESVKLVDGGLLSNFPINMLHTDKPKPSRPTFGAKLGKDRVAPNNTSGIMKFCLSMLNTSSFIYDYDFVLKNDDYEHLIAYINTDEFNWLDFKMSDERKVKLFIRGAEAAAKFLNEFDWKAYQALRVDLYANR